MSITDSNAGRHELDEPVRVERDAVERLADEFLTSYRAGECPTVDDYVHQYPALADDLRGLLKAMMILEDSVPQMDLSAPSGDGTALPADPPRHIGDFLVVREIGRGGMGIVYEAVQQSLDRQVALKVLSLPGILNPSHLERFRREARAAARLQHRHIVPVFGFGAHDGTHYYAMQYVPGHSLDFVIESLRQSRAANQPAHVSPAPEADTSATALSDTEFSTIAGRRQFYRSVARIGLQAAGALAYAHAEGVLHRDIKPSNLLLDAKGNIWITDFGLAKTENADELTHTGDFVGTLRYMAPERLEGWSDRCSDLYGLGVTLYELLTVRPFFATQSRAVLLRRIANESPPAPRKIDPDIPLDLETIVLKATAKEPAARYRRAEQMVDDLQRFLADRPILARRTTAIERFGRWCRRNPATALLATTVAALLVAAIAILTVSNTRIRNEATAKEAALEKLQSALNERSKALSDVWLYRGLYGMDGSQEESLNDFNKALEYTPNDPRVLWLRGFALGGWKRYDEALADMTKARDMLGNNVLIEPANRDWFVSMLYVAKGDRAGYQAAVHDALRKIPTEPDLEERGTLLWLCTMTPQALDDATELANFVDEVLPPYDKSPSADRLLVAGAALYRAGKFAEACDHLQQSREQFTAKKPTRYASSPVWVNQFLAMTNSRLGRTEEAQANLAEADHLAKEINPECWVDSLTREQLADEAKSAIKAARE